MTKFQKRRIIEFTMIFCIGSLMYGLLEVIYRGFTHPTMALTGGVLFLSLYFINLSLKTRSLVLRGLIGAVIITCTEFFVGVIVNLVFDLHVWDYSGIPGNILGQICLPFSIAWFFLSLSAVYISVFLFWQLNKRFSPVQEFD